ncbi:MAG: hypothetical protein C0597_09435 [Marinilabiliales bacterium]|nr:MAG: hypothetical protein C0597_09435 [Marinilabiliales bacterium]
MKKLFKIFSYLILTIILLIIVLMVIAKLAENKITDIALKKVSESIEAPVSIDDVSFNLLRKFPLATIELNNVLLSDPNLRGDSSKISNLDTIINIKKIYISVKSKPLLKGNIEIMKVDVDGANINYRVDTSGITNIDFLITSSDTMENADTVPTKPLTINLTDLTLKNIQCNYDDSSLKANAKIIIPELKVKAKLEGDNIWTSINGGLLLSQCAFEGTNLYLMNTTDLSFDVDYENDSINIRELNIITDGADFNVIGSVVLGTSIKTDIQLNGRNLRFDELIKYAPKEMLGEFGLSKISGQINLDAKVKGYYSETEIPQIDLNIQLLDGNIVTKDYPELKNISFTGKITNGILKNNQSTQADFSKFHFETGKSKFDISFSLLDIDHPKYIVNSVMEIDVGEFKKFIPDSVAKNMDGTIKATVNTKGELPDTIGDDFVDYLMSNTAAKIIFSDFNADLNSDLSIKNFSATFNYKPYNFSIGNLSIDIPTYNFELRNTSLNTNFYGSINDLSKLRLNVKRYHLETKGAVISGSLDVKNLNHPSYDTKTRIALTLEETKSMLPDSLISELSGSIIIDIDSKATLNLDSITDQAIDAAFTKSILHVSLKNLKASTYDNSLYNIENLYGEFGLDPTKITINDLKGIAAGVVFEIDSTVIKNLYNAVLKNQPEKLLVETRINLGDLDYQMFAPFMMVDTTKSAEPEENTTDTIKSNYTMEVKGAFGIKSLKYDSIVVKDISSLFNITDSVYIIDQFKFKAFNGEMNSSVKYALKAENKSVIETKHIIHKMDINKLLADFDNFEDFYDPAIKAENLSGLFSTNLFTRFNMIGDSLIMNDVRVKGDIKLEDGGVYNYEPATSLSKFTGID